MKLEIDPRNDVQDIFQSIPVTEIEYGHLKWEVQQVLELTKIGFIYLKNREPRLIAAPEHRQPDYVEMQHRSEYDRDHNSNAPFFKE